MNGYQRIMAAFQGKHPDTVPVMLHNFMMAAREAGLTMEAFRDNPREMARAFIEAVEKYEYDGIMIDVDTVTLAGAAGVPINSPVDQPSVAIGPRLQTLEEVRDLEPVDIRHYRGGPGDLLRGYEAPPAGIGRYRGQRPEYRGLHVVDRRQRQQRRQQQRPHHDAPEAPRPAGPKRR